MITLDIGCGKNKAPGSIGIDCCSLPGVDIVHDANKPFTMFADSSIDKVIMGHSLEHLHDIVTFMNDMYRILKPGGTMLIDVPHAGGLQAFTDPTHKSFFTMQTMDYFTEGANASYYSNARFEIVESRIVFMNHGILEYIFNMRPIYFEKWLRVVPLFSSIHWELKKV